MNKILWGPLFTRKNPIGIHNIINTATPEKMMVIKNKFYFPNNSLLTICGAVKHDDAFAMAEQVFGDWANSGFDPFQKYPIPPFIPLPKTQMFVKESTIAKTPYIEYGWQGPSFGTDSASAVAADVFSTIVGMNASKLQQALVSSGLATYAGISTTTCRYTSPVTLYVIPNPTKLKECYAELAKQLSMFGNDDYYTDQQLKDAKAILLRNDEFNKEKPSSLPSQVSYAWCSESLNYYTDNTDDYQKVSRADIKKFLDDYIAKPFVAGMIISPDMNKTINATSFFAVK